MPRYLTPTPSPVLGVLDATLGSSVSLLAHQGTVRVLSSQPGVLFEDISFGLATCALSLATNLAATLLIAYKAWYVHIL